MTNTSAEGLAARLQEIRQRMREAAARVGRAEDAVTLVAVSKFQPVQAVRDAYALGVRDFGENYAQELVAKATQLGGECPGIRWHFIGRLQSNKINMLKPYVAVWQTVASAKDAAAIGARSATPAQLMLQVNVGDEVQKSGVDAAQAVSEAQAIKRVSNVILQGLMCIPKDGEAEAGFRRLVQLRQALAAEWGQPLALSMGMSGDFEQAIALGATHIRVGTALFGERQRP